MKANLWKAIGVLVLLAFAFVLFWTNRFQYEHAGPNQVLVRINRFTSQECYLTTDRGWDSRLVAPPKGNDSQSVIDSQMYGPENKCQ